MQSLVMAAVLSALSAQAAPVEVTADLRAEYLVGDKVLVPVTLSNTGSAAATVPDLSNRPWLVGFEIQPKEGNLQRRRTAAPEADNNRTLTLAPRARRNTLLEIPSSGAIPKGEYTLRVSVNLGDDTVSLDPKEVRVVSPKPAGGQVGLPTRDHWETLWVHEAAQGFDLYLHQLDADKHDRASGHWYLGHVGTAVQPWMARSRTSDEGNRVVVWQSDARTLQLQGLAGNRFHGAASEVVSPWPTVQIAAAPLLDGRGRVTVPLWVPSPKGASGELRLLSFDARDRPVYRRVGRFDQQPAVSSGVDDAGNSHLVVSHGAFVDLYTVRADGEPKVELPVPGRRVFAATGVAKVVDAQFVVLDRKDDKPGGMALQVTTRTGDGFGGAMVSLRGTRLADLPAVPASPSQQLVRVVPGGWDQPGFVLNRSGKLEYVQPSGSAALAGVTATSGRWAVIRDGADAPALLRMISDGPVGVQALTLRPRS